MAKAGRSATPAREFVAAKPRAGAALASSGSGANSRCSVLPAPGLLHAKQRLGVPLPPSGSVRAKLLRLAVALPPSGLVRAKLLRLAAAMPARGLVHAKLRWGVALASGLVGAALFLGAPAHAQPLPKPVAPPLVTPSVTVDPAQPGATPHWTITLGAEYCGGYRVGDGVYVSPEAPLSLAAPPPDGSTLFAGQPASMDWSDGTLRIGPGQGLVLSMVCLAGQRPLKVELLPDAGLSLPTDPGDYAIDVWTGANPTPTTLTVSVPTRDADTAPPSAN